MNQALSVTKSFETPVKKEVVWDAFTNPETIKKYLFGTETITTWKKGDSIIFQGEYDGKSYKDKGVILEIEEHKLLKYSYWSGFSGLEDTAENYSTVSYELHVADNTTILTLTQVGFASEEAQQHSNKSWEMVLDLMKSTIEKG